MPQNFKVQLVGIDRVLENKIGWGTYQKRALAFLCLIDLNDGVELILMTIILPIIKKQYQLETVQIEIVSSVFYLGMFIGAYTSGISAGRWGRRPTIMISQLCQGLIAIYFSFLSSYSELVCLRILNGIVYGFSLPLSTTLYSEIAPIKQRGKGIVFINSAVGGGKLFGILMAYIIMTDIQNGNWKLLVLIASVPCFLVSYGIKTYVHESPRFLMVKKQYQKLEDVVNSMIVTNQKQNQNYCLLDESDMQEIKSQNEILFKNEEQCSTKQLFKSFNKYITIRIWIMWFLYHTMSKGQLLILPFIIAKTKGDLASLVLTLLGEIPAIILAFMVVDESKYFGRKKTIIIFFTISIIANYFSYLNIGFSLAMASSRFCYREVSSMLYTYTTEVYPTNIRVLGIGWATGMGRLGTFLMSFYLFPLIDINPFLPFLVFSIFSIICAICAFTLPVDTTGKVLDVVLREFNKQEQMKGEHINLELLREPSSIKVMTEMNDNQENEGKFKDEQSIG